MREQTKNAVFEKVMNYLVGADNNYKSCGEVLNR